MKYKVVLLLLAMAVIGFGSYNLGRYRAWTAFTRQMPFDVRESTVDFENERWILKTESVHRTPAIPFDTNRWVVTLTDKPSGQSMALFTVHPSFTKDPWDTALKFRQTSDGLHYWSDVASFSMKWPEVDFHYQKGFEDFGETFYLGAPRR